MTTTNINVCPHDCWDTCSMRVTVDEGGKAVKIRGNSEHPITKGFLCIKVNNYLERVYSPDRILYPMLRVGDKGEASFKRISWGEAVERITDKFKETIYKYGTEAVLPFSYAGTMGVLNYTSMDRRFFGKMGASTLAKTFCIAAGGAALDTTFGKRIGIDPEDMVHSKLIIAWGTNTIATNVHQFPIIEEARKNGAIFVVIDPFKHETAQKADLYLQIKPGTDSALALGIMNILIAEDLIDHDYVRSYLHGYEELAEKVKAFTPEKVEEITGINKQQVIELARLYGNTKASVVRCGFGVQRHTNGGELVRTIGILPTFTGAWKEVGGGFLLCNMDQGFNYGFNYEKLHRTDIHQGNPREINCSQIATALHDKENPIHMMYVFNSNPALVAPDSNRVLKGLMRDDLFVVVHEQHMTETCKYADIVLPATTTLEQWDIHPSYWHLYIHLNEPAIAPLGEAKSNTETFRLLAKGMGYTEECFYDTDEDLIRQALDTDVPFMKGITFEALKEKKFMKIQYQGEHFMPFENGFFTESGKVEAVSISLEKMGLNPLVTYTPIGQKESDEVEKYPLLFLTPKAKHFLNSTFGNIEVLKKREKAPVLYVHPKDAATRGINEGDEVTVFNNRGEVKLWARLSGELTSQGVVVYPINLWERNANFTTSDDVSDIGGGAIFYSNFVEVKKLVVH
ncbi:molybdopterin-containing oxidoreductase family protein [Brevibacillus reuszeri]|uniref:molybdopterin-containing oxidoreductase family protein n=1 Tax=Brevibacillus reuszeri TaxID=54915 RepID=UPI003D2018F9